MQVIMKIDFAHDCISLCVVMAFVQYFCILYLASHSLKYVSCLMIPFSTFTKTKSDVMI